VGLLEWLEWTCKSALYGFMPDIHSIAMLQAC
jgi:hypothetical protein